MSLIEEALRRAQEPRVRPKATPPPAPTPEPEPAPAHSWRPASPARPSQADPPANTDARPVPLAALAALLCAGLALIMTTVWTARRQPPTAQRHAPDARVGSSAPAVWNLTGVVAGSGDAYAVVNGAVVRTGDQISGALVEEIAPNAVRLRLADGTATYLQVPR